LEYSAQLKVQVTFTVGRLKNLVIRKHWSSLSKFLSSFKSDPSFLTKCLLSTNVFGAINVTRAFLPYMREKRSGTIVFIGSLGGWMYASTLGI